MEPVLIKGRDKLKTLEHNQDNEIQEIQETGY